MTKQGYITNRLETCLHIRTIILRTKRFLWLNLMFKNVHYCVLLFYWSQDLLISLEKGNLDVFLSCQCKLKQPETLALWENDFCLKKLALYIYIFKQDSEETNLQLL